MGSRRFGARIQPRLSAMVQNMCPLLLLEASLDPKPSTLNPKPFSLNPIRPARAERGAPAPDGAAAGGGAAGPVCTLGGPCLAPKWLASLSCSLQQALYEA